MSFRREKRTSILREKFQDYYSGECPFCGHKIYKIIDSWTKTVPQIGGPAWKVFVEIEMKRIKCLNHDCTMVYTPEHPDFPKGLQFSLDVVEKALNQAHHDNMSTIVIAEQLLRQHQVEVSPKTVQSWINNYSEEFFQDYFRAHQNTAANDFKAITIDGTWFKQGKDVIGKKKLAQSYSVTKLPGGHYLLTWWE